MAGLTVSDQMQGVSDRIPESGRGGLVEVQQEGCAKKITWLMRSPARRPEAVTSSYGRPQLFKCEIVIKERILQGRPAISVRGW